MNWNNQNVPIGLVALVFVKACHVIFNEQNSSDFRVTGCCLVTFVWCDSIGAMRKCFVYDVSRTLIFPQCEKGSNILATIYVCQWVQALHDFPCIYRITTRTLHSVFWGSNNEFRFEFYIYFWYICNDLVKASFHVTLQKIKMVHKRTPYAIDALKSMTILTAFSLPVT